jgi:hypothetical protein
MGRIVPPAPWEKWPQRKSWCDSLYNKFNLKGKPMSEWITDRLPTKEDSFANQVIIAWDDGSMCMTDYKHVEEGMPWTPIPKPEPYVKPEPQRWKPESEQLYHYVTDSGFEHRLIATDNEYRFLRRYDFGNCFKTQAQAQEAARRVRELLLNYHEELSNE